MSDTTTLTALAPVLLSRDLARTAAFYAQHLGFETVSTYPDYLILRRDGLSLHFALSPDLDIATNPGTVYLYVTGIDSLYARCHDGGVVHPNAPLRDQPYGVRDFTVLDPDNNQLKFGEPAAR